jgi:hypothetical protein
VPFVPGTDLGSLFASYPAWRRTGCLAPIWAPCLLASGLAPYRVPGTDLGPLFASYPAWRRTGCLAPIWAPCLLAIRPGAALGAWHRFGLPVC